MTRRDVRLAKFNEEKRRTGEVFSMSDSETIPFDLGAACESLLALRQNCEENLSVPTLRSPRLRVEEDVCFTVTVGSPHVD